MGLRGPLPRRRTKHVASPPKPLEPPTWLPADAVEVWGEVEPPLRAVGRLRAEHRDILANWCATSAELRALAPILAQDGSVATGPHGTHPSAAHSAAARLRITLLTLGKALGLDPASSTRLEAMEGPPGEVCDSLQEFAASRDQPSRADNALTGSSEHPLLDYVNRHRSTA